MPGIFETFPYELILASSSPRRRELLQHLGLPFTIEVPGIDEQQRKGELPADYVLRNSLEKAIAIAKSPNRLVIAADTIGVLDGVVLEKPIDAADAQRMLMSMSGRSHEVLTGVTVALHGSKEARVRSKVVRTVVHFKVLNQREIAHYVGSGEPLDKAGSYGIQGGAGFMVEKISGSFSNVVGLPMAELVSLLSEFAN